jgi:hypothetical protein
MDIHIEKFQDPIARKKKHQQNDKSNNTDAHWLDDFSSFPNTQNDRYRAQNIDDDEKSNECTGYL